MFDVGLRGGKLVSGIEHSDIDFKSVGHTCNEKIIALFEYCFQVPANRIGSAEFGGPFSIWELKVIQEVVSLSVFTVFALVFMKSDTLRWNHLAGFLCLVLAVYFIFRK